jgi:hypothetical protein
VGQITFRDLRLVSYQQLVEIERFLKVFKIEKQETTIKAIPLEFEEVEKEVLINGKPTIHIVKVYKAPKNAKQPLKVRIAEYEEVPVS